MVRQLHAQPAFADRFLTHMLTRNIRIEEDLIDQLFNSSEKRLARTLLLLARYGEPEASHRALAESVTGNVGRDGWDHTLARELLHEQVSQARVHRGQRRLEDQQLPPQRRPARLITRRGAGGGTSLRSPPAPTQQYGLAPFQPRARHLVVPQRQDRVGKVLRARVCTPEQRHRVTGRTLPLCDSNT